MNTAVCNLAAVGRLLTKAGHPNTYDIEALTFMRHAYNLCDKAGVSLAESIAIKKDSHQYAALSTMPKKALLDNVASLELIIAERDAEITRLKKSSKEKDAEIAHLEAVRSDEMKIGVLEERCSFLASASANKDKQIIQQAAEIAELKSHLAAIQDRLRETEAHRDAAQQHARFGVINDAGSVQPVTDAEYAEAQGNVHAEVADKMVGAEPVRGAGNGASPASVAPELEWSEHAKAKLVEYAIRGLSALTIGRKLAREFGGRVTSSTVAMRLRSLLVADADGFLWATHWR